MAEPIEGQYFNWLCSKVLDNHQLRTANYIDLLRILYSEPFTWEIQGDHNRAADGKELRVDFLREAQLEYEDEPHWFDGPCSILEMLIAFAKRAEFQTDISYKKWFWKFLENLGLSEYRRITGHRDLVKIEETLNTFIHRTYRADGYGGILPMHSSRKDQRREEIWHQFFEYIEEQGM